MASRACRIWSAPIGSPYALAVPARPGDPLPIAARHTISAGPYLPSFPTAIARLPAATWEGSRSAHIGFAGLWRRLPCHRATAISWRWLLSARSTRSVEEDLIAVSARLVEQASQGCQG